jgi:hypothetical protein
MFKQYFASIRFYRLKRKLQQFRLQFFIAIDTFDEEFRKYGLWPNTESHLGTIMSLFPTLISIISEVEAAESWIERGDIFKEARYIAIAKRDMLNILKTMYKNLEENLAQLLKAQEQLESIKQDGHAHLHLKINSRLLSEYPQVMRQLELLINNLENTSHTLTSSS